MAKRYDMTSPLTRGELLEELSSLGMATKADLSEALANTTTKVDFSQLRSEWKSELSQLRSEWRADMSEALENFSTKLAAELARLFRELDESRQLFFDAHHRKMGAVQERAPRGETKVFVPKRDRRR